jgi:P-type conjugative transfer ATPase TrbB
MNHTDKYTKTLHKKLLYEFGPQICALLDDPTVIEIMLNAPSEAANDGDLWVERLGSEMEKFGSMSFSQAENLMRTIASSLGLQFTEDSPILECELPFDGSRFEGVGPPVVTHPTFSIRKRAIAVFTLEDYVAQGIMSQTQREVIQDAVHSRQNILIAGGTGSGKTTLTNAVVRYISDVFPNERPIILEDTRELQCTAKNRVMMKTAEDKGINMTRLVKTSLRLRPDRLLVGEVRDGAAFDLLLGWDSGHPGGLVTLHANSANSALRKMELLISLASKAPLQAFIAQIVNMVVYIEKEDGSRRIKEIIRVTGYDGEKYLTESLGG